MAAPWRIDEIEFQRAPHEYYVRGQRLPSVTTLLRKYGLGFQGYAPQEALDRGNYVHDTSVVIDQQRLFAEPDDAIDWSAVPEKWRGYLVGYIRARRADGHSVKVVAAEKRLWHPELWYAGTLDRAIMIFRAAAGRRRIRELKTGDATDVECQVAGYVKAYNRWFPDAPVDEEVGECLRVNRDGTYNLWELDLVDGWRGFAACLVIEERRRRNGTSDNDIIAA